MAKDTTKKKLLVELTEAQYNTINTLSEKSGRCRADIFRLFCTMLENVDVSNVGIMIFDNNNLKISGDLKNIDDVKQWPWLQNLEVKVNFSKDKGVSFEKLFTVLEKKGDTSDEIL